MHLNWIFISLNYVPRKKWTHTHAHSMYSYWMYCALSGPTGFFCIAAIIPMERIIFILCFCFSPHKGKKWNCDTACGAPFICIQSYIPTNRRFFVCLIFFCYFFVHWMPHQFSRFYWISSAMVSFSQLNM